MAHQKNSDQKKFEKPRHWVALEELSESYWGDGGSQEKRGQEFLFKPVETIANIDKIDSKGMARRDFLTVMGASMAMASLSCARRPVSKIIPYVNKPEEVTPGVPNFYASTFVDGTASTGILVKTREGRPIKLEGNPDHPTSLGALSAKAQGSLLGLYDPDRLRAPQKVQSFRTAPMTWSEIDQTVVSRLKSLAVGDGGVRFLTAPLVSPSASRLTQDFLQAFKNAKHVEWDVECFDDLRLSQKDNYGTDSIPNYHFDRADVIVSFGANFIDGWLSPTEYAKAWSKNRKVKSEDSAQAKMSETYVFESTMTPTGSNADHRYAIAPGDELSVAAAVAYEIARKAGVSTSAFSEYSPEAVAAAVDGFLTAKDIKKVAKTLWAARGRSLVVGGSLNASTKNAHALQATINFLNSTLENEGKTVDGTGDVFTVGGSSEDYLKLKKEMASGKVDLLVISGLNPGYMDPTWEAAVAKVPMVLVVTDRVDETAKLGHYVLASHHALEAWGDVQVRKSIMSLVQPTIAPLGDTRSYEDLLLNWASKAGLRVGTLTQSYLSQEKEPTTHTYLKYFWKKEVYPEWGHSEGFEIFWENTLRKGVANRTTKQGVRKFSWGRTKIPSLKKNSAMKLALYEMAHYGDGAHANNAWLQELPDPVSSITWDNFANIAPSTAKKMGIRQDDVIEVTSGSLRMELPVNVQPGMHPRTISVATGYGRFAAGRVGNGTGVNVYPFASWDEEVTFSGREIDIRKTGRRYQLAAVQGHHRTEGRPIINDITLEEFQNNPKAENHTDPHLRLKTVPTMWTQHKYPGYRWGMAIDLNSCTGCGACVVACQAENNIPVVGRDRVRVGREMHWIRVDRYYAGSEDQPDVVYQPLMCQHCENASCETVCPVLATVHGSEGLNEQAYNRCVGTRYCSNNCPYKARRFNFFDHWKDYKDSMNLVWNPDVTVRSRGIMEKCTFCVQRINSAKDIAKKDGRRKLRDGELKTACQQTCPTDAITFGNTNDANSMVSQQKKEKHVFHSLEILNNLPQVSYLTKVRNKEEGAHHGKH